MAVNQNGMQAGKHSIACSSRVNNRTAMDTAQSLRMASVSHNRKSRTVFLRIICFVCKLSFFALAHSQECAGYDIADGRVTVSVAHRNWETSKTVQLGFAGQVTASKCEGAMLTTSAVAAKDCPPPARSCVKVWLNEATEENLQLGLDLPYRERSLPQRRQFACDVDAKGAIVVNSIACEDIQPPSPPPPPRPPSPFPPPPPRSPPPPRPSPPPFPPLLPRPPETPWPSPPPSPPPPPPPPSPSPPPLPPPSPPPSASPLPPILSALPLAEVPSPPAPPGIIPRSLFISSITSLGSVLGVMVTVAGAIKLRRYLNERKRRLPRGGRASAVGDQALGTAVRPRAKKGGKYGMVPSADDEQDDDDDEDEEQDLDQVGAVSAVLFKAKTTTYPPIVSAGFCDALKDDATTVVGLSSSRPAPPPTIHSSNSRPARPNSPTVVDVPQGFQVSAQGEDKSETQPIPTLDSLEAAIIAEVKSAHTHVAENRPRKSSKMDQGQNDMD